MNLVIKNSHLQTVKALLIFVYFFARLPWDFFSGIGFYSEQVYNHDLWTPYRQGVHRFVEQQNQIYVENYGLTDSIVYAGAGRDQNILSTITPDVIERRYNCSMVFQRQEETFYGKVEGRFLPY